MADRNASLQPNDPNRDDLDKLRRPANGDLLAELDVRRVKIGSPAYFDILVSAVLHIAEAPGAPLPLATSDALHALKLSTIRARQSVEDGCTVRPRLSATGNLVADELAVCTPFVRPLLLMGIQILVDRGAGERRNGATFGINQLLNWSRFTRESDVDAREMRKLLYALPHLPERPTASQIGAFFAKRTVELKCEFHTIQALTADSDQTKRESMAWLRSAEGGRYNDPPVAPEFGERRQLVFSEGTVTFRRALRYSGAFWRLSGETVSLPTEAGRSIPMFGQFGLDNFEECYGLHSSDPNSPPGRGFYRSGARMEKLFFTGSKDRGFTTQQEETYQTALAAWGSAFREYPEAIYVDLRGGRLIYHPSDRYKLPFGVDGALAHYTLYLPNDHLDGSYEHAFLVPTTYLAKSINAARYKLKNGPTETTGDLAQSGISGMHFEAMREPPYVISLSNISTVFGGLVAGLPKNSEPLFAWEKDQSPSVLWKDARGRYHYGWLQAQHANRFPSGGETEGQRMRRRDNLLAPYEYHCYPFDPNDGTERTNCIAVAAKGLMDLAAIDAHRYGAWKNELLPGRKSVPRMAAYAYQINQAINHGLPDDQVPQLCLIPREGRGGETEAILDPRRLLLRHDGQLHQLPRSLDLWDTLEMRLWADAVKSKIVSNWRETETELAFIKPSYIPDGSRI